MTTGTWPLPINLALDHPDNNDDEDDCHENPDPDRYVHVSLLLLKSGHYILDGRILVGSVVQHEPYGTPVGELWYGGR